MVSGDGGEMLDYFDKHSISTVFWGSLQEKEIHEYFTKYG